MVCPMLGWPHPKRVNRALGVGAGRSVLTPAPDPQPTSLMACDPREGPVMAQPLSRVVLPPGAVWGRPPLDLAPAAGCCPRGPMRALAWGAPASRPAKGCPGWGLRSRGLSPAASTEAQSVCPIPGSGSDGPHRRVPWAVHPPPLPAHAQGDVWGVPGMWVRPLG